MTETNGLTAPLFVPADRPERFAKAAASGADAVIIDLEDAVAPAAKEAARAALAAALPAASVVIRINAMGTPWHDGDVDLVHHLGAVGVMLPKAEDPAAVAALGQRFRGARRLIPLIETAAGVHRAVAIAAAHGVTQLAFGPADYGNDIGCGDTPEAMLLARSTLVLASRLAGLTAPLDGPCFDFREAARTTAEGRHARALGFGGKLCIHPNQVAWVRDAFRPSEAEIAWAKEVVAAEGRGGAANLGGTMIDAPVIARARRILAVV
jgi:citrate lyase subunit beta/citryl-CoA lyase